MIVGILACAVLVGVGTGVTTYLQTANPWLALAAYSAGGSVSLVGLALARVACRSIREVFRGLSPSEQSSASHGPRLSQVANASAPGHEDAHGHRDELTEDRPTHHPIRPRRVTVPIVPRRVRPERQNVIEFRTCRHDAFA